MLYIAGIDRVEDPIEAEDNVYDHGQVVVVGVLVATHIPKKPFFGIRLAERPVHDKVPDGFTDSLTLRTKNMIKNTYNNIRY